MSQRKNETLVDEAFYVWETRYGLWNTETKEGRGMMTGATRDDVVVMTRWHLKCEQEGWPEGSVRVCNISPGVKL